MYEELVKRLRNLSGTDNITEFDEAADAIEELSKPQWIPVEERLPEERKWVLCQCRVNITDVLRLENAEWYHDPTHVYMFGFVTHWMPLPEPPKEDA